jgi:predicted ATP-dependent endonuclease of OLD family
MRLIAVGYRRFADTARIDVDGPLTAIVGPNEAGKTSLLDAMSRLDGNVASRVFGVRGPLFPPTDAGRQSDNGPRRRGGHSRSRERVAFWPNYDS